MFRITRVSLLIFFLVGFGPQLLAAQRGGFIIGFGLGPGVASLKSDGLGATRVSNNGVGTNFRIGGMIGDGTQLYYSNRVVFHGTGTMQDQIVVNGMSALGLTYNLPSAPRVHLNGGLGISVYSVIDPNSSNNPSFSGPGAAAGIGFKLSNLFFLDFDLMVARPGDSFSRFTMTTAAVTLSIVSR